jgi:hypothetical protein
MIHVLLQICRGLFKSIINQSLSPRLPPKAGFVGVKLEQMPRAIFRRDQVAGGIFNNQHSTYLISQLDIAGTSIMVMVAF